MREEAEAQERLAAERRVTVRTLFERWATTELHPRVLADGTRLGRKDAGGFTRAQFERRVFPRLGQVAVEDVKRADLLTIFDGAKAEGKLRTANVLLSDLKQMFRFALMRDLVARNPWTLSASVMSVGPPSSATVCLDRRRSANSPACCPRRGFKGASLRARGSS